MGERRGNEKKFPTCRQAFQVELVGGERIGKENKNGGEGTQSGDPSLRTEGGGTKKKSMRPWGGGVGTGEESPKARQERERVRRIDS